MEAVSDVMNLNVIQEHTVNLINVNHMEVENDALNQIVNQAQLEIQINV
jgi:hypothetical protein